MRTYKYWQPLSVTVSTIFFTNFYFMQAFRYFLHRPRRLFLFDAGGALLSAFLSGVVLVALQPYFGLPVSALYLLAAVPLVFVVFDLLCWWRIRKRYAPYLRAIACCNLGYCLLSVSLAALHRAELTPLGWAYVVVEVSIVVAVAVLEFGVAGGIAR